MSNLSTPSLGTVITNALARKIIYGVWVVAVLIVGGVQVYFAASDSVQPEWVSGANAVLVYLGIPVGGLALANTPKDVPVQIEVTPVPKV